MIQAGTLANDMATATFTGSGPNIYKDGSSSVFATPEIEYEFSWEGDVMRTKQTTTFHLIDESDKAGNDGLLRDGNASAVASCVKGTTNEKLPYLCYEYNHGGE